MFLSLATVSIPGFSLISELRLTLVALTHSSLNSGKLMLQENAANLIIQDNVSHLPKSLFLLPKM